MINMNKAPLDVLKMIRNYKDQLETHKKFKKCLKEINEIEYIYYETNFDKSYSSKIKIKNKLVEYELSFNRYYETFGLVYFFVRKDNKKHETNSWCIWDNQKEIWRIRGLLNLNY